MKKPKIAFVSTDWSQNEYRKTHNKPGAVSQYRLVNPMKHLQNDYDIDYWGSDFQKMAQGKDQMEYLTKFFSQYDLVLTKIIDNPGTAEAFVGCSQYFKVPIIVDIDDNIWEIKEDQPGITSYYRGSNNLAIVGAYMSYAQAIFCSTEPLAKYVKARFKNTQNLDMETFVLPNCTDPDEFHFQPVEKDPSKVIIGWQGSITHLNDLKVAVPAISQLMDEYPNLYFEMLGGLTGEQLPEIMNLFSSDAAKRVKTKAGGQAWDTFPYLLSQQPWDIAIAPLTDDLFNQAKSHIKWMEYSMYEFPCVGSKVYPYSMPIQGTDVIQDGHTGFLAKNDEWYTCLKSLIDNSELRRIIGKNAKEAVIEDWHQKKHAKKWKEAIDTVLERGMQLNRK